MATPQGSSPNAGTCTENYNLNISRDVNPTTNVVENNNYSDDQEKDNFSCLENKKTNEDNSSIMSWNWIMIKL